jgi:hypothetical protein
METIQLAIDDRSYSTALREMLLRDGNWDVLCVESPNPAVGGVIVLDRFSLERTPPSMLEAERVVLITRNVPDDLSRAWEAGIVSLVFDNDPVNTVALAIMAAGLRLAEDARKSVRPIGAARRAKSSIADRLDKCSQAPPRESKPTG